MDLPALTALIEQVRSIVPDRRIIIFGSSALLASFPDIAPVTMGVDLTKDADVFIDPDDQSLRESLREELGQNRDYHHQRGYYADFIDLRGAGTFPAGWHKRLRPFPGLLNVFALDPIDVATNKLFATGQARVQKRMGRRPEDRGDKDINTVSALLAARLVKADEIHVRLMSLDIDNAFLVEALDALKSANVRAGQ